MDQSWSFALAHWSKVLTRRLFRTILNRFPQGPPYRDLCALDFFSSVEQCKELEEETGRMEPKSSVRIPFKDQCGSLDEIKYFDEFAFTEIGTYFSLIDPVIAERWNRMYFAYLLFLRLIRRKLVSFFSSQCLCMQSALVTLNVTAKSRKYFLYEYLELRGTCRSDMSVDRKIFLLKNLG